MAVRGDKELAANFRKLAASVTPAVRSRARQKALKLVEKDAKARLAQNGSIETKALLQALTVTDDSRPNTSVVGQKRGRRGSMNRLPPRYAHLVEFGTAPHWQPNRFGGIMHPGARAKPFMRPAYEANLDAIPRVYFSEIWTAIVKAM
jgi:HK97 gp10 family phage protein